MCEDNLNLASAQLGSRYSNADYASDLKAIINLSEADILAAYNDGPKAAIDLILLHRRIALKSLLKVADLEERIKELEGQKRKNSSNSSKPPSKDENRKPRSTRVKSGKPSGGQKGHPGHTLKLSDNPDHVVVHPVTECSHCGKSLENVKSIDFELRQVVDLPPLNVEVTEHRAETKLCPYCSNPTKALFPEDVQAPVQYGPRLKAVSIYFNQYQLIPLDRLTEVFENVFNHDLSEGALIKANSDFYELIEPVEAKIKEQLFESPVLHADETGMRIEGKRKWCHVLSTKFLTYFAPHPKRGYEANVAMGVLPGYNGTLVHDSWASYYKFKCKHALCNGHHLRDLLFFCEENQKWANEMSDLLLNIKAEKEIKQEIASQFEPHELKRFEEVYHHVLEIADLENPPPEDVEYLPGQPKKRGRKKQSRSRNLIDKLKSRQKEVLAFMYDFSVPFDNNLSERDIRMMKLQQKISGTFRTWDGSYIFCRIRSYISTVRKQSMSVIEAIQGAFEGNPFFPQQVVS
jgi:transposase